MSYLDDKEVPVGPDLAIATQGDDSLAEHHERLRELDRMKQTLIGTVSHELRTPVTAILGILEHLRDDPECTDAEVDLLALGVRSARRLWLLVEDLLQLAEIGRDGLPLMIDDIDPALVVRTAIAELRYAGFDDVSVSVQADVVPGARGDASKLQQLVAHLLSNAAKFNRPGGSVGVTIVDGEGAWLLEVVDNGMGVAEADVPHMFAPFFRGSVATDAVIGGAGLGLAIVRAIADAHGATIQAASRLGEGTIVSVLMPKDVHA